ncbi:hypothetical protein ACFFGH_29295 [Lysobacter korlensis]|uniref:Uncharacterized protein n=1 Tax=Lysobacter korlensis TaxID=553636 RepID=A0ABV6RY92_9GAMM
MVRTRFHAVPLVLALLALSGCSLLPRVTGGTTPTPTAVSTGEAATAFSATICTFNDAAFAFDRTWSDLEAPLRDLQEAASLSRIEAETAKRQLEGVSWPAGIADDIGVIEEYLQERMGKLDRVIAAETVEELDAIDFGTPEEVQAAASEIEASLELGADYCPQTEEPGVEPVEDLAISTWSGVDSDGDDTVVILGTDQDAQVTVGDTLYEGTWAVVDGVLTIDVATTDNTLSFSGDYQPAQTSMSLSGTATNGHTWTVELRRL